MRDDKECKCLEGGIEPHYCPYNAEINDDWETLCECCEHCEQECGDDI